jgi:hypothetical protein
VHFPATYFSAFNFSGEDCVFSVQLGALIDALRVFSALPDVAVLVAKTPDHLELEVSDADEGITMHMYAHVAILASTRFSSLADHWQAPSTEFTADAATLREAIEDLEWPHGHIKFTVKAHPFQVCTSKVVWPFAEQIKHRCRHSSTRQ